MATILKVPAGPKAAKGLRALAELVEGQQLNKAEHAAAEYAHRKLVDLLGPIWASALPADRLAKIVGKQSTQLNTFAAVGIGGVRAKPIDLFVVVREAFDVIAASRRVIEWQRAGGDIAETLAELDQLRTENDRLQQEIDELPDEDASEEADGESDELTRAKIRRMEALAASSEVVLRQKAGELVRSDEVIPLLTIVADRIRAAGETIGQQFGPDAARIVTGAVDEAERRLAEFRQQQHRRDDDSEEADAA